MLKIASRETRELKIKVLREALQGNVSVYDYPLSKRDVFQTLRRDGLLQNIGDITGSETSNLYKITEQGIRYLSNSQRED